MSFSEAVLSPWLLALCALASLLLYGLALAQRPWRALLADSALQHRWLAATVACGNCAPNRSASCSIPNRSLA